GEGGSMVGHKLEGRVLIIDDVITAGTAIREAVSLIRDTGARPVGIALALDRQERGKDERSAVQEVEAEFGLTCLSILTLEGLIEGLGEVKGDARRIFGEYRAALETYRQRYGVA
ncbi:MAG TPA: phosphoribosyltransferase family protein, partial [Steroidobacteraceae bacterium]|nr:phosphoribosyltransferase family protein [Steroidobacteraceae bacterium]